MCAHPARQRGATCTIVEIGKEPPVPFYRGRVERSDTCEKTKRRKEEVNEEAAENYSRIRSGRCVRVCVCACAPCACVKRRLVSCVIVVTAGTATTTATSASRVLEARGGRSAGFVPRGNEATRIGGFVPTPPPTLGDSGGRAAVAATGATAARLKRVSGR